MKLVHMADAHLGTPFKSVSDNELRQKLNEELNNSFIKIINHTIEIKADFLVIAGDLFDSADISLSVYNLVNEMFELLNQNDIKIVLINGNHDFKNNQPNSFNLSNVYTFESKVSKVSLISNNNEKVNFYGFNYNNRNGENFTETEFLDKEDGINIGLFHGDIGNINSEYPNLTIEQINQSNYDYWALGHIHKKSQIDSKTPAYYAGNILGRNINEPGIKGAYDITIKEGQSPQIDFFQSTDIEWENIHVNAQDNWGFQDFKNKIAEIDNASDISKKIVRVTINQAEKLSAEFKKAIDREANEIMELISNERFHVLDLKLKFNELDFTSIANETWQETEELIFNGDNIQDLIDNFKDIDKIDDEITKLDIDEVKQKAIELVNLNNARVED